MTRAIIAVFGLIIIAAMAFSGLQVGLDDAGDDVDVQNESWTPDPGNFTTLDHSNLDNANYDDAVTVKDNNGDVVDPNVDYVWNDTEGTVKAVVGGALDGAPSATISYGYEQSTADQRGVAQTLAIPWRALGAGLPLFALVVLLLLMRG